QKTFSMQSDPQTDRSQARRGRQFFDRKINRGFFRHQIHIRKHHNPRNRLLGNLRAPSGFGPGVIALALLESKSKQKFIQVHEVLARTAKRMMVVIPPAEAENVLALLLHAGGAISRLPIMTLGLEIKLARNIAPNQVEAFIEYLI